MSLKKSLTVCLMISLSALACGESKPQPTAASAAVPPDAPPVAPPVTKEEKEEEGTLAPDWWRISEVCYGQPKTLMAIEHYHLSEDGTGTIRTQSLTSAIYHELSVSFLFPTPKALTIQLSGAVSSNIPNSPVTLAAMGRPTTPRNFDYKLKGNHLILRANDQATQEAYQCPGGELKQTFTRSPEEAQGSRKRLTMSLIQTTLQQLGRRPHPSTERYLERHSIEELAAELRQLQPALQAAIEAERLGIQIQ